MHSTQVAHVGTYSDDMLVTAPEDRRSLAQFTSAFMRGRRESRMNTGQTHRTAKPGYRYGLRRSWALPPCERRRRGPSHTSPSSVRIGAILAQSPSGGKVTGAKKLFLVHAEESHKAQY